MSAFLWNVLLAFLWASVLGEVTVFNLAVGFVLGLAVIAFTHPGPEPSPYARKLVDFLKLLGLVAVEVLWANLRIAWDILTPKARSSPAIYEYRMQARTDAEVTLFALLVTFTPGTLSLEVSDDGRRLYVHVMFGASREEFAHQLRTRLEEPLLRVMR